MRSTGRGFPPDRIPLGELVGEPGGPLRAIAIRVLRPADNPLVRGDLQKRVYPPAGAAMQAAGGINQMAVAAIENALVDIKAKAFGVPVYEMLGGPVRDRLQLYWSHCGS